MRGFLPVLGLFIGCVGIDAVTGQSRLTFGLAQLNNGIDVVLVAVGLFAVGEALYVAARMRRAREEDIFEVAGASGSRARTRGAHGGRGCAGGPRLPVRRDPAGGAEVPTFLSYAIEKRLARRKEKDQFGQRRDRGRRRARGGQQRRVLRGARAAADARHPDLGDGGDPRRRFQVFNLQPGPQLFETQSALVWALIACSTSPTCCCWFSTCR